MTAREAIPILIVNDDGISSPGLLALVRELKRAGRYAIQVVAPVEQQSGVGFHLTIDKPLYAAPTTLPDDLSDVPAHVIWGTPVDCVKLAVRGLLPNFTPRLVLSGINQGANVARIIPYSGTVSGALEASLNDLPAMALSLKYPRDGVWNFVRAAEIAVRLVDRTLALELPKGVVVNVNIPNCPSSELRGIRVLPQGRARLDDFYVEEPCDLPDRRRFRIEGKLIFPEGEDENDATALDEGWVTVTPLHTQMDVPELFDSLAMLGEVAR